MGPLFPPLDPIGDLASEVREVVEAADLSPEALDYFRALERRGRAAPVSPCGRGSAFEDNYRRAPM